MVKLVSNHLNFGAGVPASGRVPLPLLTTRFLFDNSAERDTIPGGQ